jgi:hypothetical protein
MSTDHPSIMNRGVPMWVFVVGAILTGSGGSLMTAAGEVTWERLDPITLTIMAGAVCGIAVVLGLCWVIYTVGLKGVELAQRMLEERVTERRERLDAYASKVETVGDALSGVNATMINLTEQVSRNATAIDMCVGALEEARAHSVAMATVTQHGVQHVTINSANIQRLGRALNELATSALVLEPTPAPPTL